MKEVYKNIYQIDIPLTGSPLKTLHAYLIRGEERNLLIDTGFNDDLCENELNDAFEKLNISINDTDIFLTHVHSDHSGLTGRLKNERNTVFCSEEDGRYLNELLTMDFNDHLLVESKLLGIPDDRVLSYDDHPGNVYKISKTIDFVPLKENDQMNIGRYTFGVVDLSGHTPGQLGLYEPTEKILFCGDHILCDISPNIVIWGEDFDSIQVFTDNLKKVKQMDIIHTFSGHRRRIMDHRGRVDELILHHEKRLKEILRILKSGEKSVYEIACEMSWDFGGGKLRDFPAEQLWFAASEAFAHVEHLYKKGFITRWLEEDRYKYKLTSGDQEIPNKIL